MGDSDPPGITWGFDHSPARFAVGKTRFHGPAPINHFSFSSPISPKQETSITADILSRIEGKFILSPGDHPEVRKIYKPLKLEFMTTTYSKRKKGETLRGRNCLFGTSETITILVIN